MHFLLIFQELLLLDGRWLSDERGSPKAEAKAQRDRAEGAEAYAEKTVMSYNEIVNALDATLSGIRIASQGDGWTVEDRESGQILVRHASIPEAYRVAIQHSLGVALQGGR